MAFDTLYAEGHRRYVESLSAYARQFLQLMEKPDVDLIEGLSPAISIEQKATSHNPRSTSCFDNFEGFEHLQIYRSVDFGIRLRGFCDSYLLGNTGEQHLRQLYLPDNGQPA